MDSLAERAFIDQRLESRVERAWPPGLPQLQAQEGPHNPELGSLPSPCPRGRVARGQASRAPAPPAAASPNYPASAADPTGAAPSPRPPARRRRNPLAVRRCRGEERFSFRVA